MESLAVVIIAIFLIALLAGPTAVVLSSQKLQLWLDSKSSIGFTLLNLLRKALHLVLVTVGSLIGVQLTFVAGLPWFPRLIGLFSLVTSYTALRREYFPGSFFVRGIMAKLGFSHKNGRSSGGDGHGPAGQC